MTEHPPDTLILGALNQRYKAEVEWQWNMIEFHRMRIGLISDSHGNPAGLAAVLKALFELEADEVHCLGDIVGYGSEAKDCLDLIRTHCKVTLLGNHDAVVAGRMQRDVYQPEVLETLRRAEAELTKEDRQWLRNLPMEYEVRLDGYLLYLSHAHPSDPHGWCYYPRKLLFHHPRIGSQSTALCVYGHTHRPMLQCSSLEEDRRHVQNTETVYLPASSEQTWIANSGSCGQPRDGDSRASALLFDSKEGALTFLRVEYDVVSTQGLFRSRGVPDHLIRRLSYGM